MLYNASLSFFLHSILQKLTYRILFMSNFKLHMLFKDIHKTKTLKYAPGGTQIISWHSKGKEMGLESLFIFLYHFVT